MPGVRSDSLGIPCIFSELAQSCPELARSSLVHRAKSGMSGFDGLPPVPEEDGFVVAAAVAAVPHGTESVMRGSHRNNRGLHFFAHLIPDRFRFACTPPEKSLTWSSWHGIGDPHSTHVKLCHCHSGCWSFAGMSCEDLHCSHFISASTHGQPPFKRVSVSTVLEFRRS